MSDKLKINFDIPEYLEHDIQALIERIRAEKLYDCELDEVYGSINLAMTSGNITVSQADLLRNYYVYGVRI